MTAIVLSHFPKTYIVHSAVMKLVQKNFPFKLHSLINFRHIEKNKEKNF